MIFIVNALKASKESDLEDGYTSINALLYVSCLCGLQRWHEKQNMFV